MTECGCHRAHESKRIVVTGGPGAGKTAVIELIRQAFCHHVAVIGESAGIVFGGGFPRGRDPATACAAQRAIFHVQRELESIPHPDTAIVLCDRGTVDGSAYWRGPDDLWSAVGTTLDRELARYHAVLHLRVPAFDAGYSNANPLRVETADEALAIDDRIAAAWSTHPRRFVVEATPDFLTKAERAIAILRRELPPCCSDHGAGASAPTSTSAHTGQ
jgi:predicted ATPase